MILPAPTSLLVIRFGAVGDIILTAPALAAVKRAWPTTRLLFATKSRLACLVADNPNVDAVIGLERAESFARYRARLAAERPTVILDLHDKLRSAALRWLLPAERTVVWEKRPRLAGLKARLGLGLYRTDTLHAARYHAAVEELVGSSLPRGELRYFLNEAARAMAEAHLQAAGIDLSRPLVGMAPGAVWETKRWPADRFAELARLALGAGLQVVLSGSREEAPLTAAIAAQAAGAVDLAGKVGLAELGALVDRCRAFVANDSGPMHLSRALGVPTLALFGSTDPRQFDFAGHALLFRGIECAPCSLYGRARCPRGHFRCMLEISAADAFAALTQLVAGPARVPYLHG